MAWGLRRDAAMTSTQTAATRETGPFRVGDFVAEAYEITALIGVGGMGAVYEAHDRVLNRHVAIKVPISPAYAQSLRSEAQALAAVRHSGLVTVYAGGRYAGHEFLVMERIYGVSLEARLAELGKTNRHLGVAEAIDLLISVADALSAAHRAGVAHRDLKPGNIMLCGSRVVLMDFGLFIPEFAVDSTNVAAGSAGYIAPEVLLHSVTPGNGPMVDLYALGVMAFELLVGRPPYMGETVQGTLSQHLIGSIPDVRAYREDVPPLLAALVKELLAKTPEDRPINAESVVWRLHDIRGRDVRTSALPPIRVIVIDDDVELGHILQRSLIRSLPQLTVESVQDPRAALRDIEHSRPDIVVVDLNMPEMNGIEVCMEISAHPLARRPLVVAMSGQANDRDVAVLRSLGVVDFVPKDQLFVARMCEVVSDLRIGHRRRPSIPPLPSG